MATSRLFFEDLFGVKSQDELDYLATASVVAPFMIYTIFLVIIPASLVMISLTYERIDLKLNPEPPRDRPGADTPVEARLRREVRLDSRPEIGIDIDTTYERMMQAYGKTKIATTPKSRSFAKRAAITGLGTTDLSPGSEISSLFPTTPILQWLAGIGQNEALADISTSDIINWIYWPLLTGGIFALAKPVVIFLFTTFLISLTVYPDEGKPHTIQTIPNTL